MVVFFPGPHIVEWERALASSSTNKGSDPSREALFSLPHLNLSTSQRPSLLILSHWGSGLQHRIFFFFGGGYKHSVISRVTELEKKNFNDFKIFFRVYCLFHSDMLTIFNEMSAFRIETKYKCSYLSFKYWRSTKIIILEKHRKCI